VTIDDVLTKWFRREEINGGKRCPTYLIRWTLFQPRWPRGLWRGFGIYLHKFVGDDWSLDVHDHPKRFVSVGLAGRYQEWTPSPWVRDVVGQHDVLVPRVWAAPWVRTFPAEHRHRIALCEDRRPCWTLVVVLAHVREWGFWHRGMFWPWRVYVAPDNPVADARKACP
jgi:hypothetical protein